jgi:hypothetical protein
MEEAKGPPFCDAMPVGIVVERRRLDNPWQAEAWLPVAIVPGASAAEWRTLCENERRMQAYAGALTIELFRKETASYRYNLETGAPKVYVVLRRSDDPARPFLPQLATAAPDEALAALEGGESIVEGVPMPAAIAEWVAAFIAVHHVDEPAYKRQRQPYQETQPMLPRRAGKKR